jgi:hypothetical protein
MAKGKYTVRYHIHFTVDIYISPTSYTWLITGPFVGFKDLTVVVMKSFVFWGIMLFNPLKINFGAMCHCHLQLQKTSIKEGSKQSHFLLSLFSNPEDGCNKSLPQSATLRRLLSVTPRRQPLCLLIAYI